MRLGCGMSIIEISILCIILLNILLTLYQTRVLAMIVTNSAAELDGKLAQAIQSVMGNVQLEGMEAPNPIQQVIAQLIQQRMQPPSLEVTEITRGTDGKFS